MMWIASYVPNPELNSTFLLEQGSANFSVKVQKLNILGFVGPMPSVATTQLCPGSAKAAIDNMEKDVQG